MAGYSGKTAPNSTSQLNSVSWTPKAPTLSPTLPQGKGDLSAKDNDGMKRTSSPNAQDEKQFEKH